MRKLNEGKEDEVCKTDLCAFACSPSGRLESKQQSTYLHTLQENEWLSSTLFKYSDSSPKFQVYAWGGDGGNLLYVLCAL